MEIKTLNVLYSLDDNFINYTKTSMLSLLNSSKEFVNFYLLTSSEVICEKDFDVLRKVRDCNIKLVFVPESKYKFLESRKMFQHLSVATYFRHFASELIEDVSKAVYIDSDTLIVSDINNILNENVGSFEYVRGVEDVASEKKMKLWDINRYINAGVLLMNLDYARKDLNEFYEKIAYFYQRFGNKTISGDQDMLNFVFRPKYIPFRYNLYHPFFNKQFVPTSCSQDVYYEECKTPVVIHFVGSRKPWINDVNHPYKGLWKSMFNLLQHLDY